MRWIRADKDEQGSGFENEEHGWGPINLLAALRSQGLIREHPLNNLPTRLPYIFVIKFPRCQYGTSVQGCPGYIAKLVVPRFRWPYQWLSLENTEGFTRSMPEASLHNTQEVKLTFSPYY